MAKQVFDCLSYKEYLIERVGGKRSRSGEKIALARAAKCQPTYVSQVLFGRAHISLEQADRMNEYLHHTKDEGLFFLLLVQKNRAGTKSLEKIFQDQMDSLLAKRLVLTERLGEKTKLSLENQATYYSSWQYAAVHIALTMPGLQVREKLAAFLNISPNRVNDILEFLLQVGLAQELEGIYKTGSAEIRLGKNSSNIIRHHSNWRQQAIESLERESLEDLHYSAVVSLSKEAIGKIKNILLDSIKECTEVIRPSPEENLFCVNVDFFNLDKRVG